jgi:hypothetical protein
MRTKFAVTLLFVIAGCSSNPANNIADINKVQNIRKSEYPAISEVVSLRNDKSPAPKNGAEQKVPAAGAQELCYRHRNRMFASNIGECERCRGQTTSGDFSLCGKCANETNQCALCGQQLDATEPELNYIVRLKEEKYKDVFSAFKADIADQVAKGNLTNDAVSISKEIVDSDIVSIRCSKRTAELVRKLPSVDLVNKSDEQ